MKAKHIILSLVATFVTAFSANAQNNTYHMVLTLSDGSTITIGPNELQNIAFNNGEFTFSGSTIDEIKALIDKNYYVCQEQIDKNSADTNAGLNECFSRIKDLDYRISQLEENGGGGGGGSVVDVSAEVKAILASYDFASKKDLENLEGKMNEVIKAALADVVYNLDSRLATIEAKIAEGGSGASSAEIDAIKAQIATLEAYVVKLNEDISLNTARFTEEIYVQSNRIDGLQAELEMEISNRKNDNAALTTEIEQLKTIYQYQNERIKNLQEQIDYLMTIVKDLRDAQAQ